MIRAYDDYGNAVDIVEHDKQIIADAIEEFVDCVVIKIGLLKQSANDEWVDYALNDIKKFVMSKAEQLKEKK